MRRLLAVLATATVVLPGFAVCAHAAPSARLTVTTTGDGRVTSDVGGVSCPAVCVSIGPVGTTVTLTATAGPSASFDGWAVTLHAKAATGIELHGLEGRVHWNVVLVQRHRAAACRCRPRPACDS